MCFVRRDPKHQQLFTISPPTSPLNGANGVEFQLGGELRRIPEKTKKKLRVVRTERQTFKL